MKLLYDHLRPRHYVLGLTVAVLISISLAFGVTGVASASDQGDSQDQARMMPTRDVEESPPIRTHTDVPEFMENMVSAVDETRPVDTSPPPTKGSAIGPRKFVVADVTAHTDEQVAMAQEFGVDVVAAAGMPFEVELPADQVEALRDAGLTVDIQERFIELTVASDESDPSDDSEDVAYGDPSPCSAFLYALNDTGVDIPDDPDSCDTGSTGFRSRTVSVGAPPSGVVCNVAYRFWMSHPYPGDLVIQINNGHHSLGDGLLVWNRQGGGNDGGMDDDAETDDDIYMNWRETGFFNGEVVQGSWYLDTWDHCPSDTGHINYIEFRIYYDEPEIRIDPSPLIISCEEDRAIAVAGVETTAGADGAAKSRLPEEKLIEADVIYDALATRESRTNVIVSLVEPASARQTVDWDDAASLSALHEAVASRQDEVLAKLTEDEIEVEFRYGNVSGFSAAVTEEGLDKLLNDPLVESIEPVRELEWHTNQGIPLMNALGTRTSYSGAGVSIAVVDSGVDYTHPRLGGGAFPNAKVIGGYDFGDNDADPMADGLAHGTCCSGIAGGNLGTVGDYIGGVAPDAKLYMLKISHGTNGPTTAGMIAGWDWCITHKNDNASNPILVISSSFGGGYHTSACDASSPIMANLANRANAAGITVLASSGNEGYCDAMGSPACISSVISVGAVYDANLGPRNGWCISSDSCVDYACGGCSSGRCGDDPTTFADRVTVYSNTANYLDILAPSNNAYTTDIVGGGGYSGGDYSTSFGGTSAACPYAAGAVAALQSAAMARTGSFLTPAQVRTKLVNTGVPVTDPQGGDYESARGPRRGHRHGDVRR